MLGKFSQEARVGPTGDPQIWGRLQGAAQRIIYFTADIKFNPPADTKPMATMQLLDCFLTFPLFGWAVFVPKRAVNTAQPCQRTKNCAATGAFIAHHSGIGWHLLLFDKATLWAGDGYI